MGFLDKAFKNVFRGARDFLKSPAGIATLAIASPFAMSAMSSGAGGSGFLGSLLEKYPMLGKIGSAATKSPLVTNAAKNAAMNYGIATLTGSENPEKAALYAAASSVPFSFMKANNMAKAFNNKNTLTGNDKLNYLDILTGKVNPSTGYEIPGAVTKTFTDIPTNTIYDTATFDSINAPVDMPAIEVPAMGPPQVSTSFGAPRNIDIDALQYFGRDMDPTALSNLSNSAGLGSLIPGLGLENVDILATITPQIAGLYGGRMSEARKWEKFKEQQIKRMAFQYGIPYEEAKEIFKDGYRNPYYTTTSAGDYGDIEFNKGGSPAYKDSYIAGGKVVGPGTGKSDDVRPVALSNNEFVITEKAAENFPGGHAGLYSMMNKLDPDSETIEEARMMV
jgi:hypothetical protein